ncbi:MAG: hypothetical protein NT075_29885, partial [Chloroflexi bacterium]|nr:hypothetical protein [Chloroflexota bacterium]
MKKVLLVTVLLFGALALTVHQMSAQQTTPGVAPVVQTLPVPRDMRFAYTNGTRSADGKPGPNYWQNHATHNMRITVMPPSRTISATQEITYVNNSPYPLPGIVFKLLQNVHRPDAIRERVYPDGFLTQGLQIDEFRVNGKEQAWGPDSGFVGVHLVT